VIALAGAGRAEKVVEGVAEGVIAQAPRGQGGFGYDPLFFYLPLGRTFAELSDQEKARVSHRGLALAAARRLLCA
jgi:XTP/dITP diphosphohydrolase